MSTSSDTRTPSRPHPDTAGHGVSSARPSALAQFVRDLASSALTDQDLLRRLAEAAQEFVQADGGCVLELEGERFRAIGTSGLVRAFDGQQFEIQPGPSLFREVIATGRAAFTNDANDPRIDARFGVALQIRQAAVAPIVLDGGVSGLLLCINSACGAYSSHDIEWLGHLADHSALVLRHQRLIRCAQDAATDARSRAEDAALAARHNAVLARTARVLAEAKSRDAVYTGIADVLHDELHAAGIALYEASPQLEHARLEYQWGAGTISPSRVASGFGTSGLGDVVRNATPMFIEDLVEQTDRHQSFGRDELLDAGVHALALLPLVFDGQPRGLLSVRYADAHRFDEEERRLLMDIAMQVTIAYRNVNYLAELERRAVRLAAMARAQHQLTLVTDPEALPGAIADAVRAVIPHMVCDILAISATGLSRVIMTRDGFHVESMPATEEELALARETMRSGVPRLAVHLAASAFWPRGASELCAVVRYGSRSAGVLRVLGPTPDAFDLQDLDLLTILARQAGAAVETSRLFTLQDFQRQRAEGAAELARVTLHAMNVADGATELLNVLDRFVPSIGKAIGLSRARDGVMEYVAVSGTLDVLRGRRPVSAKGIVGICPDGRPRELPSWRAIAPADVDVTLPDEWGFVVPLVARDKTLGVLLVSAPTTAPLTRRDRVTLERLATSLALALDVLSLDEEERLGREREHLLATALTTIDHPIFILDRVGVRYANPAAAREYGWSQVELMDMNFDQLVVGVDPRRLRRDADGMLDAGISLAQQVHRRRDDSEFPATVTVSPLLAQEGDVLGQVVSVRNMTADRRLEEQLRHTEKMIALGELVAGVAHEINNPLTGISAFAQLLLEEPLDGEQLESVQLIKKESDRAKAVIHDLLLFARKADAKIQPVDINDLIGQTLRLRAYPLRNAGVQVKRLMDSTIPDVPGDLQNLQQVLINLISNAEHAMSDMPTRALTVRTSATVDEVLVSITDTGRGMSAEVRRRIFEPFFTTRPAGVGTGLGLSVSYGIVQAHGGRIDVQSEPGVGTTVTVSLPLVARPADALADDRSGSVFVTSAPAQPLDE